ncbi:MAG: endonuclease III [Labrys sp. (in: a-proteobacteria)]
MAVTKGRKPGAAKGGASRAAKPKTATKTKAADNTTAAAPAKAATKVAGKGKGVEKPTAARGGKAKANAAAARAAARRPPLSASEIEMIFERFQAVEPEPKGELEHVNPYTLLVAVVLSAQATDAGVNKATRPLFAIADTPEKMVALGEDRVRDFIKTIGLFRNKARNVILLSQQLIEQHAGIVPQDRAALETLPGVGRKTANVVLNMAFGQPTIAVDTHLFRVANRTGLAPGKDPLAVELALEKAVPARFMLHAHHWLILHGRYVCKAQKPACGTCPIADICRFEEKTA